eukprot:241109_1
MSSDTVRLQNKQAAIYQRLCNFLKQIKTSIQNVKSNDQLPSILINIILDYSGHKIISDLWLKMFFKLRQFSFLMDNYCTLDEIQAFENNPNYTVLKYGYYEKINLNKHIEKKLPSDMKISLLLCNYIRLPPVFKDLTAFESAILPLTDWFFISPQDKSDRVQDWCYDFYFRELNDNTANQYKIWFDDYMMRIGGYGRDITSGLCRQDRYDIYWNIKTNKILVVYVEACNWSGECRSIFTAYDSFTDFFADSCGDVDINDYKDTLYDVSNFIADTEFCPASADIQDIKSALWDYLHKIDQDAIKIISDIYRKKKEENNDNEHKKSVLGKRSRNENVISGNFKKQREG